MQPPRQHMQPLCRVLALGATLLSPLALHAQISPTSSILVLSKHDHTLAIVDTVTLQVQARVPVGDDPHEVIASADGTTAYVSNYGGGAFHTLAVIDLRARKALPSIDLGALNGPHGLYFLDGKLWFTAEGAKAFGRYDPASGKIDLILGTGQNRTHMIWVAPGGEQIVTTNVSSGTVSLIDRAPVSAAPPPPPGSAGPGGPPPGPARPGGPPRPDWNETVLRVGNGSEGFDVSPDGREIWVANAGDGTVSVIDRASKTIVATLQANVRGANRLKFTPDGRSVLISTLAGPDLVILDAARRKEAHRVPIGHGAAGILIQPDGARAYIACTPDNYVAVVDLHTLKVVGHIDPGPEPDGMAWATQP